MSEAPQQSGPDPVIQGIVEEEQRLLNEAVQRAQTEYLFNRVISLNLALRQQAQENSPEGETEGPPLREAQ